MIMVLPAFTNSRNTRTCILTILTIPPKGDTVWKVVRRLDNWSNARVVWISKPIASREPVITTRDLKSTKLAHFAHPKTKLCVTNFSVSLNWAQSFHWLTDTTLSGFHYWWVSWWDFCTWQWSDVSRNTWHWYLSDSHF